MCESGQKLGPFQRMARNMGLDGEVVARLPAQWPACRWHWASIADALFDAGYPAGEELLKLARRLWLERPDYLR
jgi:hypothetical protein